MHLRTRLICSEIIYFSFEKVEIYSSKSLKELCAENRVKIAEENMKALEKWKFQYFKNRARLAKIFLKTRTSCRRLLENVLPSAATE